MDFKERLQRAVDRGRQRGEDRSREAERQALSEEELKRIHSRIRLALSEHIESCVAEIAQQFPGFSSETLYGEAGWGAACSRDDIRLERGKRTNLYSRLEMTIRPFKPLHVIELAAKATVHNREIFHREYFEELPEIDQQQFEQRIDAWAIEFAERFAAADEST